MSNIYNKILKNHLLLSFILLFVLSVIIYNSLNTKYEGFRRGRRR